MSAHNEQNGRHTSFPVQSVAPSDPRIRNLPSTDQVKVCRDFVWGNCYKHGQCKFRHECSLEEMTSIIRFCHDHQNKKEGCIRPDCTYLHTSSEEENLFLTTGKLPRILLERHAAMNAAGAAVAAGGVVENTAPLYVAQPPPPPPPPLAVAAPPPPPPLQPVHTLMPPPPPPPPKEPASVHNVPPATTSITGRSNTIVRVTSSIIAHQVCVSNERSPQNTMARKAAFVNRQAGANLLHRNGSLQFDESKWFF